MKIFTASKKILKREQENYYPYEIDGLIYLPVRKSVKGHSEGVQSKYIGGTWNENFKWKPEHLNTIDFLGKVKKTMKKAENMTCRKLFRPHISSVNKGNYE